MRCYIIAAALVATAPLTDMWVDWRFHVGWFSQPKANAALVEWANAEAERHHQAGAEVFNAGRE